ncbi:hypothetical protein XH99_09835 [Bradyrhizobium nanningense]|uniref:Uncharacterized protein n=1 Tax=Bradyrhizobium nanningense TaxID=1325118 RepID=A0A4Q0S7U2_9BRAD|nr:hypothetical protein XH99_09835 [Bradyrhizobium nanningense]RXH34495.1 hypothetical protein XH84_06775 [Bradyrhizobium nanningense]
MRRAMGASRQQRSEEGVQVRPIKQMGCDAGRLRCSKVALFVPDHEASINIYWVPLKQSCDHARLRLPAIAEDTITLNQAIGVMWAKLERIDVRTNNSELTRHPVVQIANVPLLKEPSRNS